jgi:hypothetical protein
MAAVNLVVMIDASREGEPGELHIRPLPLPLSAQPSAVGAHYTTQKNLRRLQQRSMVDVRRSWCQQLPKLSDNLRQQRSRRPGSVRPARVPSAFGQVSSPGHVHKSTRAGTCPCWTSDSPTTLHVCSSAYGPGLRKLGVPPQAFALRPVAGERGVLPALQLKQPWEVALCVAANAIPDRTSDARSLRR